MNALPVLFLDLDGTVRHGKDELGHFVNTEDDVVIFPEARERITAWTLREPRGGVVIGVTNQAGVALGHISRADHKGITRKTRTLAGLDWVVSCTHDPDASCWCRKPMPGLIYEGLRWLDASGCGTPRRRDCLMVGDRPEDQQAAAAAGVPFQWAADWRAGLAL